MGYGQTVFSIKQSARIVITSKRGRLLPYYGKTHSFQYYINLIFCFFSLLIGKNTFIYDIRGTVKKTRRQKGKVIWGIHATRYWRRGIANAHLKELNFLDVSLPYYLIKTQLKKVIYQYRANFKSIGSLVLITCFFVRQNRFGTLIQTFSQKTAKNQISGRFPPLPSTRDVLDILLFTSA